MRYLRTSILLLISISSGFIFTKSIQLQDTSIVKYLPLQVGNVWVYEYLYSGYMAGGHGFDKIMISDSASVNGHIFYNIIFTRIIISGNYSCDIKLYYSTNSLRIDSNSYNIYKNASNPCLADSLNAKLRDTAFVCGSWHGNRSVCTDTSSLVVFGLSRKSKKFYIRGFEGYNYEIFVKGIGLYSYHYVQLMSSCTSDLQGCIISGLKYGDTSFTGILKTTSEIPERFELFHNYPNPFNPSTKIRFSIPADSRLCGNDNVLLKVYDVLGREVQTLVNEQLQPGSYEVEFIGTEYSSGVYYYVLSTDSFSETKKMVLLK